MADQSQQSPQERLVAMLVDKIAEDRFPSITMMEFVERNLRPEQRDQYLHALLDKIQDDKYPSLEMMKRVERLS